MPGLNAEGWVDVAFADMLQEALATTEGAVQEGAADAHDPRARLPQRRLQGRLGEVLAERRILPTPGAALARRIRRWVGEEGGSDAVLSRTVARAIDTLKSTPPVFILAAIRTWTWSWVTHHMRGRGLIRCPMCFRAEADMLPHVATCRTLWCQISRVIEVRRPRSVAEAIGRTESAVAPGKSRPRKSWPQLCHLALAIACDAYHKVSAAESFQPARGDTARRHRIEAAVKNATRRLGGL